MFMTILAHVAWVGALALPTLVIARTVGRHHG